MPGPGVLQGSGFQALGGGERGILDALQCLLNQHFWARVLASSRVTVSQGDSDAPGPWELGKR